LKKKETPWIVLEDLRERAGKNPCDQRRTLSALRKDFPTLDFSQMVDECDAYWGDGEWRETDDEISVRISRFLDWLAARPECNVVVVTHSQFLLTAFNKVFDAESDEPLKKWFENCEIRSTVLNFPEADTKSPSSL